MGRHDLDRARAVAPPRRSPRRGGRLRREPRRGRPLRRARRHRARRHLDWRGGGDERPAHVFTVPFSAAGVAPPLLSTLAVTWRGGAASQQAGGAIDGALLHAWSGGAWTATGAGNGAPPAVPADASWTATSGFERLFTGDALNLAVAAVPRGTNGTGVATVTTAYAELKATYRLCLATGRAPSLPGDCCTGAVAAGVCQ